MLIECIANRSGLLAEQQKPKGLVPEAEYPITPGKTYRALGMMLWNNSLELLVVDDWGGPCFCPAGLFLSCASALPRSWEFRLHDGIRVDVGAWEGTPLGATWGPLEIFEDERSIASLVELEPAALDAFGRLVSEADDDGIDLRC